VDNNPTRFIDLLGLIIDIPPELQAQWIKTRANLVKNGYKDIIHRLQCSPKHYSILPDNTINYADNFNPSSDGGTIWWNPNAILTDGNVNLSADSILGHELSHADGWNTDPTAYNDRVNAKTHDAYDNLEEKRVIQGPEAIFQMNTGQGIRQDHRGDLHY
jgi:hypothetical protein